MAGKCSAKLSLPCEGLGIPLFKALDTLDIANDGEDKGSDMFLFRAMEEEPFSLKEAIC